MHSIGNKTARVFVIDTRVDTRGTVRDVLKEIGFDNVIILSSIKEAWDIFSADPTPPTWVVSSLMAEDSQNALHLLALFLLEPTLHHCRLSLVIEEQERFCLLDSFELGLLSFHMKPFTKVNLRNELEIIVKQMADDQSEGCWTAASCLRKMLNESNQFDQIIAMEESLIKLYPANGDFFINLAEAQKLAGKTQDALRTVSQAKLLGARVSKGAQQLVDVVKSESETEVQEVDFATSFSVKNVLIIDSDQISSEFVKQTLSEIGVMDPKVFADGEAAWEWVEKNGEPDLVILEWKIPKLTGPALIQRFRSKGFHRAILIVYSALVKGPDKGLLREFGVATVIEKPTVKEYFVSYLMGSIRQEKFPTQVKSVERQLYLALESGAIDEAKMRRAQLEAMPDASEGIKKGVDAAILLHQGDFAQAKSLAIEAIRLAGDSLILLNLLGKSFLKLRAFEDAVLCFNKAQEISAGNLERLCALAEAQAELGQSDAADQAIEKAKKIDGENELVKIAESKVALTEGDVARAKSIIATLDSLSDVIAFTNNRAVSLARSGKSKESQELYEKALSSLPESDQKFRPLILYNLAMSFARVNELTRCDEYLGKAQTFSDHPIAAKVNSLKSKVAKTIASGGKIEFKGKELEEELPKAADKVERIVALDAKAGTICLHGVFFNAKSDQKVQALLKSRPKFRPLNPSAGTKS